MRQPKNSRLLNAGGYEITEEEAEAVLAERDDIERDEKQLRQVACGLYLPAPTVPIMLIYVKNVVIIEEMKICCLFFRNAAADVEG